MVYGVVISGARIPKDTKESYEQGAIS